MAKRRHDSILAYANPAYCPTFHSKNIQQWQILLPSRQTRPLLDDYASEDESPKYLLAHRSHTWHCCVSAEARNGTKSIRWCSTLALNTGAQRDQMCGTGVGEGTQVNHPLMSINYRCGCDERKQRWLLVNRGRLQ
jgi:hypothetical protein